MGSDAVRDFDRRYLECCNERRFADLAEFVDSAVRINGIDQGFDRSVARPRAMVEPFPEHRLSADFADTGVHAPTGRAIDTQEFAVYRVADGKIVEAWGM